MITRSHLLEVNDMISREGQTTARRGEALEDCEDCMKQVTSKNRLRRLAYATALYGSVLVVIVVAKIPPLRRLAKRFVERVADDIEDEATARRHVSEDRL